MIKDPNRLKHLDKECARLVTLLVEAPMDRPFKESLSRVRTTDGNLKPDLNHPFVLRQGEKLWWCENYKKIGFEKKDNDAFVKIVHLIYEDTEVNPYISFEFIVTSLFQCLVDVRNAKNKSTIFSGIFREAMENSIQSYQVYLRLTHLNVRKKLKIGEVEIGRFKDSFFDTHINGFRRKHGNEENIYDVYKNIFSNQVYAKVYVRAEPRRAKELALDRCTLAIDMLKVCSPVVVHPMARINFDIDRNTRIKSNYSVLMENLEFHNEITAQFEMGPRAEDEAEFDIQKYNDRGLQALIQLLKKFPSEKDRTELQRLTIRSLQRFAKALSEPNQHRRVADLFTVLEALLSTNQNAPIMENVTKYLSKLIWKTLPERKQCISLIKKMYGVRSAYLHHAKEVDIELADLALLQVNVYSLIFKMITKSIDYKTKEELFSEIDEAIIAAYTPKIFRN